MTILNWILCSILGIISIRIFFCHINKMRDRLKVGDLCVLYMKESSTELDAHISQIIRVKRRLFGKDRYICLSIDNNQLVDCTINQIVFINHKIFDFMINRTRTDYSMYMKRNNIEVADNDPINEYYLDKTIEIIRDKINESLDKNNKDNFELFSTLLKLLTKIKQINNSND